MAESAGDRLRQLVAEVLPAADDAADAFAGDRPDAALRALSRLKETAPDATPALLAAALRTADPPLALDGLARLAETLPASAWPATEDDARALVRVLAASAHLADLLVAAADRLDWLLGAARRPWTRSALRDDLRARFSETANPPDWGALRRWHRIHLLRVALADVAGWVDIRDSAADLAALADVTIEAVARAWEEVLTARYGPPVEADGERARWCVIGLGKLGGDELNFRSDIDLMFLYSGDGATDGGQSGGVTLHEWFSRWAERVVDVLAEVSGDGMLYRVDTRLRPDGRAGALARSLASYVRYYETRGEVWERQMLIKARPVAGDAALGEAFLEQLAPFIFPRSHALSPREEIRRIKTRILAHLAARDPALAPKQAERNLKLRRGGLRDIEFIVQCLQLVVGGAERGIRQANTLAAIEAMAKRRVMSAEEVVALADAYRLYRRVEHRIQMTAGHRTFDLPDDPRAVNLLARRLDFSGAPALLDALDGVRAAVTRIYDDVLGPPESPDDVAILLGLAPGADVVTEILAPYGFADPTAAHRNLRHLAFGHAEATAPTGPRPAVVRLVPGLLAELKKSPDPDRGLTNVEQVLRALGAVESFSDLLASHPGFLELLVTLCAGSQALTDTVLRDPAIIDWMLYSGVLTTARPVEEVELVLRAAVAGLDDPARVEEAIHRFRKQEVLRVGLRALLGLADAEETCGQLTAIADAVVGKLHRIGRASVYAHRGRPRTPSGSPAGLAVLGLGKLGSAEMNFGSDLDLVFVHESEGSTSTGAANIEAFTSLAQAVLRGLTEPTAHGVLYEVDTRLRPEGRNGPLTLSLVGYRHYLGNRASTWERQALTRARLVVDPSIPCCGEEPDAGLGFGADLMATVAEFVYNGPRGASLIDEVASMRERMEAETRRQNPDRLNIKTGPGGLVDAEFVAQLGQMLYGADDAELRGRSTGSVLARLRETGRLPESAADVLIDAWGKIRRVQMALRISEEHAHNALPSDPMARDILARRLELGSSGALEEWVDEAMRRMRAAYGEALAFFRARA